MTRKARRAAKHAAGQGKGRPTPSRPPGGRTRAQADALEAGRRRVSGELLRETGSAALDRAIDALRGNRAEAQKAIEHLAREAGAVDLSAVRRTQGRGGK